MIELCSESDLLVFSAYHLGQVSQERAMELLLIQDNISFRDKYFEIRPRLKAGMQPHYCENIPGFKAILEKIANNKGDYTHSEIIAFTAALEEIRPVSIPSPLIDGLIVGLRKFGINHNTRSNIAKIILKEVQQYENSVWLEKSSYDCF